MVVLHGHGDNIEPDDNCDEQVQIVAGAYLVDEKPCRWVIGVIGFTLGFWRTMGTGRNHEIIVLTNLVLYTLMPTLRKEGKNYQEREEAKR